MVQTINFYPTEEVFSVEDVNYDLLEDGEDYISFVRDDYGDLEDIGLSSFFFLMRKRIREDDEILLIRDMSYYNEYLV